MDWSFDLLTETEQRLLRRLSVFPQDFDLEAATAAAGDDADPIDVLDLLARLIDKSLVVPEGMADTARYRLLETVRQYAAEKLGAAGEADATRDRHRRHFVGRILAADRDGTGFFDTQWAQHTAIDRENNNAALTSGLVAGDLEAATVILAGRGVSWSWGAAVPTAVDSIDPEALTAADPSLHVAALISLGAAGIQSGRWTFETAFPILERALAIAEERGRRPTRVSPAPTSATSPWAEETARPPGRGWSGPSAASPTFLSGSTTPSTSWVGSSSPKGTRPPPANTSSPS